MTTSTITTTEIDEEIAVEQGTFDRLTAELRDLEAQQKRDVAAQSIAIANRQDDGLAALKNAIRSRAGDIEAQAGAIDAVARRIAGLRSDRRRTAVVEARERADQLIDEAEKAAAAVDVTLQKLVMELNESVRVARLKIHAANSADLNARDLAGEKRPIMPRDRTGLSRNARQLLEAIGDIARAAETEQRMSPR